MFLSFPPFLFFSPLSVSLCLGLIVTLARVAMPGMAGKSLLSSQCHHRERNKLTFLPLSSPPCVSQLPPCFLTTCVVSPQAEIGPVPGRGRRRGGERD
jgi:hypothetical protein